MKYLIAFLSVSLILANCYVAFSQDTAGVLNDIPQNYKKRSPIYDYAEKNLNSVDTIPDFSTQKNKLKITGTIYESDGVTPAKNVLLFIHQADENGKFELKRHNKKRYVHHRGWVRTNEDGKYTIYTFVPGSSIYSKELQQILPIVKEPNKPEYKIETFLFDTDPMLTDKCRAQVEETDPQRILKLDLKEGLWVGKRDIVLGKEIDSY